MRPFRAAIVLPDVRIADEHGGVRAMSAAAQLPDIRNAAGSFGYPFHAEHSAIIPVPADVLFAHLDDPRQLGAHMERRSWMMAGSRMAFEFDRAHGRAAGSVIRLSGQALGLQLSLVEVVTQHEPPHYKTWETTGTPHLLVIGSYRMGYEIVPSEYSCRLRVFIDYRLPSSWRWLARLLGPLYARWCVRRMVDDAVRHFAFTSRGELPAIPGA